ncbi:hypothetical protein AVEN_103389-1 [Araneus ventricosus]|uniref:Uncharacterized protein n=1 Tax=Araneus ventricosus TaxID=182803 RepID=A0A4Y2X4C8_ARAVE|nr:hypothetical protein AVEN_103389-1 [Araneus ventricosus]
MTRKTSELEAPRQISPPHQRENVWLNTYEVESINFRNGRLHSRRCSLEGKYLFWRLAALIRKTHSHLEFISSTVGVSCRLFLTKRIVHSSDFEISSLEQRANIKFCVLLERRKDHILRRSRC